MSNKWFTEPPKENGLYWVIQGKYPPTVVEVFHIEMGLVIFGAMVSFIGTDVTQSLNEFIKEWKNPQWCGPILPPWYKEQL